GRTPPDAFNAGDAACWPRGRFFFEGVLRAEPGAGEGVRLDRRGARVLAIRPWRRAQPGGSAVLEATFGGVSSRDGTLERFGQRWQRWRGIGRKAISRVEPGEVRGILRATQRTPWLLPPLRLSNRSSHRRR